jgi:hypothetical protein
MKKTTDGYPSSGWKYAPKCSRAIHLDLLSLIKRDKTSIRFVALAAAMAGPNDEENINLFISDDVTPRYATVDAALKASHAAVGEALLSSAGNQTSRAPPRGRSRGATTQHSSGSVVNA